MASITARCLTVVDGEGAAVERGIAGHDAVGADRHRTAVDQCIAR